MSPDSVSAVLGPAIVAALGRTILHSVWQIALVAALTALALGALRRATSNVRYLIACGGLLVACASV